MYRHSFGCLTLGFALTGTAALAAPPCRLGVRAQDRVIWPGEDETIDVWAHFPLDAYAFASADFNVKAEIPQWTFATDGVIVGNEVQGISVGQIHDPFNGIYADPSNPLRVWSGVLEPDSYEPRLVDVKAQPTSYFYYPSEDTPSSVECEAASGYERLFINPIAVGPTLVAPAEGTSIRPGSAEDYFLAGDVRADGIEFGFLFDDNDVFGIRPLDELDDLTIEFEAEDDTIPDTYSVSLNYEKVKTGYQMIPRWSQAAIWEYGVILDTGDRIRFWFQDQDELGRRLDMDQIPTFYTSRVEHDRPNDQTHVVVQMQFYFPTHVEVGGRDLPNVETIEIRAIDDESRYNIRLGRCFVKSWSTHASVQVGVGDKLARPGNIRPRR